MKRVVVGARGSRLSLCQTRVVVESLKAAHPGVVFHVQTVRTGGDIAPKAPLVGMGRGIFVKEIERALSSGEVDMAVHSLKDLPTRLPKGLVLGAVTEREDPGDALVDRWGCPLADLPAGARLGTSSPRRAAQLREARPDVEALPIRGNVETRLRKVDGRDYDGLILAAAGLRRLGLEERIAEVLSAQQFVPAPGQGALALEAREDDHETLSLLRCLDHAPTRLAVTAERAFLEAMGGGCQIPVGAYGRVDGKLLILTVFLASADGERVLRAEVRGRADDPHGAGKEAYLRLVERGAMGVLASQSIQS